MKIKFKDGPFYSMQR